MHFKKWENYGLLVVRGYICASVFSRDKMIDTKLMLRAASGCRVGGVLEARGAEGTCPPSLKLFFFKQHTITKC